MRGGLYVIRRDRAGPNALPSKRHRVMMEGAHASVAFPIRKQHSRIGTGKITVVKPGLLKAAFL
jgi:hypothetical protein